MSAPRLDMAVQAIAAGFVDGTDRVRITLSLAPGGVAGQYDLARWPVHGRAALAAGSLRLQAAPWLAPDGNADRRGTPFCPLPIPVLVPKDDARVLQLWRDVITAGDEIAWTILAGVLLKGCPPDSTPRIGTPAPHAALLHPFLRGRAVLDALSQPGSVLAAGGMAPDRRYAEAGATSSDAGSWPGPEQMAALVLQEPDVVRLLHERLHDAHRASTPGAEAGNTASTDPFNDDENCVLKRFGTVLADPVLQRLFGLAIDLEVPLGSMGPDGFVWLGAAGVAGPEIWTLARLEAARIRRTFVPATRKEAAGQASELSEGLVVLSPPDAGMPGHYDLCTLDPELTLESDQVVTGMRKTGRARGDQVQTLRSGGLRLLDRDAAKPSPTRTDCAAPETVQHRDAGDMVVGRRLDVALDTADGAVWRSPMHRIMRYAEPATESDWLESELTHLLGPADGPRRMELSAAFTMPAVVRAKLKEGEQDNKQDADTAQQAVDIVNATIVAWSGDPMGVPLTGQAKTVPSAIGIDQTMSLPSHGHRQTLLAMPMRFGWGYRAGLRAVFPGGVAVALDDVAECHERLGTGLPRRGQAGRRLLRHERVGPPALGFTQAELAHGNCKATNHAVIAADARHLAPQSTTRLLLAPGVPLMFAMLHDIFHGASPALAPTPRPGAHLPRGARSGALQPVKHPPLDNAPHVPDSEDNAAVLRPGALQWPHYPDPAAAHLVLRLRRPDDPNGWLEEALVLPLADGAAWPDTKPVHLTLRARSSHDKAPRLRSVGAVHLGAGGERLAAAAYGALPVMAVDALLRPGEDLILAAWCIPSAEHLARWFDPVEAAGLLAATAGVGSDHVLRCYAGLSALTGQAATPPPAAGSCAGPGGMQAPDAAALLPLARLLHAALRERPAVALAAVQELRVTFATLHAPIPVLPQVEGDGLAVVRRHFPGDNRPAPSAAGGETRLDFLQRGASTEWTVADTEEGALDALFGGWIEYDPATTSGIELRAEAPALSGTPLDDVLRHPGVGANDAETAKGADTKASPFGFEVDAEGAVTYPSSSLPVLRIDGLPPPEDGRPGMVKMRLEMLQAQAHTHASALTASLGHLAPHGARLLRVSPQAISRHAPLITERPVAPIGGLSVNLWLPATERPPAPVVREVVPVPGLEPLAASSAGEGWRTAGWARGRTSRIMLERPWDVSGQDELLGIVQWPPSLFTGGRRRDDLGADLSTDVVWMDSDLGPGGHFVTRWGADPVGASDMPPVLVPPRAVWAAGHEQVEVPRAAMPLFGEDLVLPTEFMTVALRAVRPLFDPVENAWFVDITLAADAPSGVLLRLGLVRYQRHAREDWTAPAHGPAVRLRVSPPIAVWTQPLPPRRAEATWRVLEGRCEAVVTLRGPAAPGGSVSPGMRAELRRATSGGWMTANRPDGRPCAWQSWDADPAGFTGSAGPEFGWTCRFETNEPGPYTVFVEEVERAGSANTVGEVVCGGPRFMASIDLTS